MVSVLPPPDVSRPYPSWFPKFYAPLALRSARCSGAVLLRDSHSQISTPPTNSLLGSSLQSPLELQVVDTLPDGFTISSTLGCWLLSVSSPDSDSVDEITLLGLVAQSPSLVGSGRSGCTVDNGQLSVLPTSNSRDELENVRLLLGVELLQVFVGTHLVVSVVGGGCGVEGSLR
jgi:hypothetical protein